MSNPRAAVLTKILNLAIANDEPTPENLVARNKFWEQISLYRSGDLLVAEVDGTEVGRLAKEYFLDENKEQAAQIVTLRQKVLDLTEVIGNFRAVRAAKPTKTPNRSPDTAPAKAISAPPSPAAAPKMRAIFASILSVLHAAKESLTTAEISDKLPDPSAARRHPVDPRLSDLTKAGMIVMAGLRRTRKPNGAFRTQPTYAITAKGIDALSQYRIDHSLWTEIIPLSRA